MNDPFPKPSRASLLALLVEAKLGFAAINSELTKHGHAPLSDIEQDQLSPHLKSEAAPLSEAEKALKAQLDKHIDAVGEEKSADVAAAAGKAAASLVPNPSQDFVHFARAMVSFGISLRKLSAGMEQSAELRDSVVTTLFHWIVDVLRAQYPELYAEYHEMKYPGGDKTKMTPETKRKAYLFAFEKVFDKVKG